MSEKYEDYEFQYGLAVFESNGKHIKDVPVSEEIMELFLTTQTPDRSGGDEV